MNTLIELTSIFRRVLNNPDLVLEPNMDGNSIRGWDSLTHIELISAIEDHFGLTFSLNEVRRIRTVNDILQLIYSKSIA